CGQGTHLPTF
nr:immunoglobulin light chain junction region [Macaca mulatta]MOW73287.1 immunoglobulin light chain junction region [Macaca mulatta]MOW74957.1 immunoglobulin light chain junction region [Macaca mulatta]